MLDTLFSSDMAVNDTDFELCLRQMSKKDSTTKIKSLSRFSDNCLNKDVEIVKSILPDWSRVFTKLALVSLMSSGVKWWSFFYLFNCFR